MLNKFTQYVKLYDYSLRGVLYMFCIPQLGDGRTIDNSALLHDYCREYLMDAAVEEIDKNKKNGVGDKKVDVWIGTKTNYVRLFIK